MRDGTMEYWKDDYEEDREEGIMNARVRMGEH